MDLLWYTGGAVLRLTFIPAHHHHAIKKAVTRLPHFICCIIPLIWMMVSFITGNSAVVLPFLLYIILFLAPSANAAWHASELTNTGKTKSQ